MTRVPKLRAWVSKDKVMGNVVALTKSEDVTTLHVDYPDVGLITLVESESIIAMQAVGLQDAKGIDIYEGDILVVHNEEDPFGPPLCEVFWSEDDLAWMFRDLLEDESWLMSERHWDELEVVGNIYENKEELLRGLNYD